MGHDSEATRPPWGRLLRHPATVALCLLALVLVGFGAALRRSFVSEDFLILGRLSRLGFREILIEELTGPWMGVHVAPFYRPLSTLALQLEHLVFGLAPLGYMLSHLALHVVNALLVLRLLTALSGSNDRTLAISATLVFALYPAHVNTVLFIASYATLMAVTAALAGCLAYLRGRVVVALGFYLLALGCYEQVAVLPALLAVHDLLAAPAERGGLRRRLRAEAPFWVATLLYFVLRAVLLGSAVGGYENTRTRLLEEEPLEIVRVLLLNLVLLVYPRAGVLPPLWLGVLAAAVLVAGSLLAAHAWWRTRADAARLWLLGVAWILATQLPFAFQEVVTANGRYVYLTSIGLGLLVVAAGRGAAALLRLSPQVLTLLPALLLAGAYLPLLRGYSRSYAEAADLAERIRDTAAERATTPGEPLFLGGCPDYVNDARGSPVAQVYCWGLSDALAPPFAERDLRAYPLPALEAAALAPLLDIDGGPTLLWWFEPAWFAVPRPRGPALPQVEIRPPAAGELSFGFRSPAPVHRLVLLTRVNPLILVLGKRGVGGWGAGELPVDTVALGRHLYGDVTYWWVEGRSRDGTLLASSRLQALPADG